jgi:alkanesulfonate monooxygenase SsuD/methylene tetrahydromethanopterin reductase-like flavin-dependent oxidoreductase (luciferase family)
VKSHKELIELATRAESQGVSVFTVADQFSSPMSPLVALSVLAEATTTIRLGTSVLANDFRYPAVLAKEAATLDLLSGGRLELGIGSGWLKDEYRRAGVVFDEASVRIERLEECVQILIESCINNGGSYLAHGRSEA